MESLIEFLQTMPFWYWWVLAVGLLTIELMTGSTYFLWPAISAALVGLLTLWPLEGAWQIQLLLFAGFTTALSIFAPRYVKPWLHKSQADHMMLNERGEQKVGRKASVDSMFENGIGKIRLGDTLWLAESETGADFNAGEQVEITRTEGTKLFVRSV